jgi:hypothetical protein
LPSPGRTRPACVCTHSRQTHTDTHEHHREPRLENLGRDLPVCMAEPNSLRICSSLSGLCGSEAAEGGCGSVAGGSGPNRGGGLRVNVRKGWVICGRCARSRRHNRAAHGRTDMVRCDLSGCLSVASSGTRSALLSTGVIRREFGVANYTHTRAGSASVCLFFFFERGFSRVSVRT